MTMLISWLFLAYFVILMGERVQSLARMGNRKFSENAFSTYVNIVAILSLVCTLVMLAAFNSSCWGSLFDKSVEPDYMLLAMTAGVALVAGMVHTERTLVPVQFIAYAALIAAIVLRTFMVARNGGGEFRLWYSMAYTIVFSMAIPVVYPAKQKRAFLYVLVESIVSFALIVCFTLMLYVLMQGNGANLLWWIPACMVLVGDTIVVLMQRKEGPNYFVMVFGIITVIMFIAGKIIFGILY